MNEYLHVRIKRLENVLL